MNDKRVEGKQLWRVLVLTLVLAAVVLWPAAPAHAVVYFSDDAEGTSQMVQTAPWDKTQTQAFIGSSSWTDSPSGNYSTWANYYWVSNNNYYNNSTPPNGVLTSPSFNLSGTASPRLSFAQRYDLQNGNAFGVVQISTNGGTSWSNLYNVTGTNTSWTHASIDLSAYKVNNVKIRFFVATWSIAQDGWYIDNIRVGEPGPDVSSVYPANGSASMPVSHSVYVNFDKVVDLASVNSSTFVVRDNLNNPVPGTITCDGMKADFKPSSNFQYSTLYTVTLTTGITAADGYPLSSDYSWSFTTMPTDVTPPTGTVEIVDADGKVCSTVVNLRLSASDNNSGVYQVQFSNDGSTWSSWYNFSTNSGWELNAGAGAKTVYVRYRDYAGNISSSTSDSTTYEPFSVDYFAPFTKVPSLVITGTRESGWTVSVAVSTYASPGTISYSGNTWSCAISDLIPGDNNITITSTNGGSTKTWTGSIALVGYFWDYADNPTKMMPYGADGEWAVTTATYHTPGGSYTDSPQRNYTLNTRNYLYSPAINLTASSNPTLYFKHRYSASGTTATVDYNRSGLHIFDRTALGGFNAATYNPGVLGSWTQATASLTNGKGYSSNIIRFAYTTAGNAGDGWYIDNIFVGEATDSTLPTGQVRINNDAAGTNSLLVTLNLTATDTGGVVSLMQFSNDQVTWSPWEDYQTTKSWFLSSGSGVKTVYARYKDASGNLSTVYSDTINLDQTAPTLVLNAVPASTATNSVTVSGTANDANPVTVYVETNTTASDGNATVTGSGPNYNWTYTIRNLAPGANGITVTATDSGGNVSSPANASITLNTGGDVTAPTGTLLVNNNAASSASAGVTLNLTATDAASGVDKMRFLNTNGPWGSVAWTVYQSTYSWTLTSGEGTKTVYGQFMDAAGNISATVSDSIYLDTSAPVIIINPVTTPTSATSQTVAGSIYDATAPITVTVACSTGFTGTASVVSQGGTWYTWSINLTGLVYGNNQVTVTAVDGINNKGSASTTINSTNSAYWNDATDSASMTKDAPWGLETGAWADSPLANYTDTFGAVSSKYLTTTVFNTSAYTNPMLTFKIKGNLNSAYRAATPIGYDALIIEYSTDGGTIWYSLYDIAGWYYYYYSNISGTYQDKMFTVSKSANFRLRFRFFTNGDGLVADGIYIDDIRVYDAEYVKPYVTNIWPADGATGVPVNTVLYGDTNETISTSHGTMSVTGTPNPTGNTSRLSTRIQWTPVRMENDTLYTVTVSSLRDLAVNVQTVNKVWTFRTEKDTIKPVGSITINSGAAWTKSRLVTLNLSATDHNGIPLMRISNDGVNWSPWEARIDSREWYLTEGDGLKTVYVQYKDQFENVSLTKSASINLDTVAPQLGLNPVTSPTNTDSQTVGGSVYDINTATVFVYTPDTDASDGAAAVSNSHLPGGTWSYNIISFVPKGNPVSVVATDLAGNQTTVTSNVYYDNLPPTVTGTSPTNNLIEVPVNSAMTVTFSEAVKDLNGTTFTLKDINNNPVVGSVVYAGNSATFTPTGNLAIDKEYVATVTTGAKDLAGNSLASAYTWKFRTVDTVLPTVGSSNPVDGSTGVPLNKIITITFSENIQKGVNFNSINLKQGTTVIESTYSIAGNVLTVYPNSFLEYSKVYTVTVPTGAVKDLAGNAFSAGLVFSFTTVSASAPLPQFTGITAGTDHSLAVRGDGLLVGWGTNDDGQVGDGRFGSYKTAPVLVRNQDGTPWSVNLRQIEAGHTHSSVVLADSSVWAWGQNGYGQLGDGMPVLVGPPNSKLNPVKAKTPGADWVQSAVYQADYSSGTLSGVKATAGNKLELDLTDYRIKSKFNTNAFGNWFNITKTAGTNSSQSIVNWSTLSNAYRWTVGGGDTFNGLGFGYFEIAKPDFSSRLVIPMPNLNNAPDYTFYTSAFAFDGVNWQVKYGWATTGIFVMEVKQTSGTTKPFKIRFGGDFGSDGVEQFGIVQKEWESVGANVYHNLSTWWHNDNFQDELFSSDPQFTFTLAPYSAYLNRRYAPEPFRVYSNTNEDKYRIETVELTEGATLYLQWGNATVDDVQNWIINKDLLRESNYPASGEYTSPVYNISSVGTASGSEIRWSSTVPANTGLTVETNLSADGGVTWNGWQSASNGGQISGIAPGTAVSNARLQYRTTLTSIDRLGTPQLNWLTISVPSNSAGYTAAAVYSGVGYTVGLKSDGTVWVWGVNNYGQLGNGSQDVNAHANPVQVPGLSGIISAATGSLSLAVLKNDGTVWTWGDNSLGQLGSGNYNQRFTPGQVAGLSGVVSIAAGDKHMIALKNDGTVWAWGDNSYGQLGVQKAVYIKTPVPVQVPGLTAVTAIDAGLGHSVALRVNGEVWAWGRNIEGQVGNGGLGEFYDSPQQVSGIADAARITAGGYHNLTLKSDGTVWGWGRNGRGQLGDGTIVDRKVPVQAVYDTTAPQVVSTSPAGGAVGIPNNSKMSVTFDEPVDPISVSASSFVVTNTVTEAVYSGTVAVSGNTVTFTPTGMLGVIQPHRVIFKPGVKDMVGNPSAASHTWTFTTTDITGPNCEVIIDGNSAHTSTRFVTLTVYSDDDSGVVAYMQFSNDGTNWAPWQPYETNTNWYLSPGDGVKNVYVRFADSSWNTSGVFSDSIVLHTTIPQVTASTINDSVYMPQDASIVLTFNEPIQPGFGFNSILLRDIGGNEKSVNKVISGNTLTIEPLTHLANDTLYTLIIPANAINDQYGLEMTAEWVASFTAGPDTRPPGMLIMPAGDVFTQAITVIITADEEADIYYTTNGTEPTTASSLYTEPFTIISSSTLKVMAKDGSGNTSFQTQEYVIDPTGARVIDSIFGMNIPVAYGGKVFYPNNGLKVYDPVRKSTETVVDAVYALAFSSYDPDNGKLVYNYVYSGAEQTGLLIYDILTGETSRIAPGLEPTKKAAIYGNRIIYHDPAVSGMKLVNLDTLQEQILALGEWPYVALKGNKAVYHTSNDLYLHNVDSGEVSLLAAAPGLEFLRFADDSEVICWTSGGQIYSFDLSSSESEVTLIAQGERPSATGGKVYYDALDGDGKRHVFSKDLGTAITEQLSSSSGIHSNMSPMYSNDILTFLRGSSIMVRDFNVEPPTVTASPNGGIYPEPVTVTIASNRPGTVIRYTLNGENPLISPEVMTYSQPIEVSSNQVLRFYGTDLYGNQSQVITEPYVIGQDTSPPTVSGAELNGDTLVLTFDEPLDLTSIPTTGAFEVRLEGARTDVTNVTLGSRRVSLKLAGPAVSDDVRIDYSGEGIRDLMGIPATGFTGLSLTNNSPSVAVTGISLNKVETQITQNTSETLIPTINPSNAANKSVAWTTSNSSVATVSNSGLVQGVGAGTADITVTTADGGFQAKCTVTVTNAVYTGGGDGSSNPLPVTGVNINTTSLNLTVGQTQALVASVIPANASVASVGWSSSDSNIASVNNLGTVTGVSVGSAVITVTTVDGGFKKECNVVVSSVPGPSSPPGGTVPASPQEKPATTMQVLDSATNKQGAEITSQGGVIQTTNSGVVISVPQQALQTTLQLTVKPVEQSTLLAAVALKANAVYAGEIYEFGPPGTVFAKPVRITLKFNKTLFGINDDLAPYYLNPDTGVWEVMSGYTVDWDKGTVSFETSHFSKYSLLAVKGSTGVKSFADLRQHWAKAVIEELAGRGIVNGKTEKAYDPDGMVTRAEFARLLAGALGLSPEKWSGAFSDVAEEAWYCQWVEAAYKAGLIKGSSGRFMPNQRITRQEMAVMIVNALAYKQKALEEDEKLLAAFEDSTKISDWAKSGMAKAVKAGIISGRSAGKVAPLSNATRAEAAVVVKKLLDLVK